MAASLLNFHSASIHHRRPYNALLFELKRSGFRLSDSPHLNYGVGASTSERVPLQTGVMVSPSANNAQASVPISTAVGDGETPPFQLLSASDVVKGFYDGINRHDLPAVEALIAENCVYEDLVFPRPFVGRKDIMAFFSKFIDSISTDLKFVVDDISSEDTTAVGVTWHLEWKGTPFPFSKGCSFYRLEVLNNTRQIVYGRDCVEPAIKPGASTLVIISAVTWLLQRFPQLVKWL